MEAAELKEITDGLAASHAEIKALIATGEQKHEERVVALVERIGAMETRMSRPNLSADVANHQSDEVKDLGQKAWSKWLRRGSISFDEQKAIRNAAIAGPDEQRALLPEDDTQGGYFAPSEFVGEVIKGVIEMSPVRSVARVRTTSNRSVFVPKRTGTFAAVWLGKSDETRSETTGLTYGMEEVSNNELTAMVDIAKQDLEDAQFDLEGELRTEFAEQFGVAESLSFVLGDGQAEAEGFMTNTAVGTETITGGDVTLDGTIDLVHGLKSAYARNAVMVMRRSTVGRYRKLKDGGGTPLWQAMAGGNPSTIIGERYVEFPDMAAVANNATPVAYGDFRRAYWIIDRIQMEVSRDPYSQSDKGRVRFIARKRVGGQVVVAEAIRKLDVGA